MNTIISSRSFLIFGVHLTQTSWHHCRRQQTIAVKAHHVNLWWWSARRPLARRRRGEEGGTGCCCCCCCCGLAWERSPCTTPGRSVGARRTPASLRQLLPHPIRRPRRQPTKWDLQSPPPSRSVPRPPTKRKEGVNSGVGGGLCGGGGVKKTENTRQIRRC